MKSLGWLVVLAAVMGCGSTQGAASQNASSRSVASAPATQGSSNAAESDEQVLDRALTECFEAADRNPEQRGAMRPICICMVSGGESDPTLVRDLRAGDEAAMEARGRACATPSMLIPFAALDRCFQARPNDAEGCARLARCVLGEMERRQSGPDFDAWFTALTSEERRTLGAESAQACVHELSP